MKFDDRPEPAIRLEKARISRGFSAARDACQYFGWPYPTYISHENGTRGIIRAADKYAAAFRVSKAWLLTGEGESPAAPLVPLLGFAAGALAGENIVGDTPLEQVKRPPGLENVANAYALRVRGSSMEPQFFKNDLVFINPNIEPVAGDTIIIQQEAMGEIHAFIKRYKKMVDGTLVATQHNKFATIEFPRGSTVAVHKVLTVNELYLA